MILKIRVLTIVLVIKLFFVDHIFAQNILQGIVLSKETQKPLSGVSVLNSKNKQWSVTNEKGHFNIYVGDDYEINFHLLGKTDKIITGDFVKNKILETYLEDKTLKLNEVIITAKKKNTISSSTVIDKYAIEQFQTFSLADVLQQLPGKTINSLSLNNPQILSLRTAIPKDKNKNNSVGVSYILDEVELSNDENMERYGKNKDLLFNSNMNTGFDLRNIPSSNIEKIEIISGIPDAKYGNLTSGVIKVDRRAGYSPLRVSSSINHGTTSMSMDKGFKIGSNNHLSTSLDYLNANIDPRNNLDNYNRITSSLIFSHKNSSKSVKNTTSLTFQTNIDGRNIDEEHSDNLRSTKSKKNYGFRFNNRFRMQLNKIIDEFKINTGLSYFKSHISMQSFENSGGQVVPLALDTSLHSGAYTPPAFMSKRDVFGNPISFTTNLSVNKNYLLFGGNNNISFGINFKYSDNKGRGVVYNAENAHAQTTVSNTSKGGVRPLNFAEHLNSQKNIGIYIQDNMQFKVKDVNRIKLNLGLRYDYQSGFSNFGPRINTSYKLTNKMSLRGGVGFVSKAPSLASIFPGNFYFDKLIKDYRTNFYSFNLVQTNVKKIDVNILKPSKSWKYEIGSDIKLNWAKINVTGYYSHLYDGFSSNAFFELGKVPEIKLHFNADPKKEPTYSVTNQKDYIQQYFLTKNSIENFDKGIELSISFKKIKALNTSFSLSGSYISSKKNDKTPQINITENYLEKKYVIGYYQRALEKYDYSNFRLTTTHHVPYIRLLLSLTTEFFPYSVKYAAYNNVYPYAYSDRKLNYHTLSKIDREKSEYSSLFLSPSVTEDKKRSKYFNFHLRLTKEMASGLSILFHATNFLNYKPEINYGNGVVSPNQSISFGGTMKYMF